MTRFGSFEFDSARRRLSRDGESVHLTPKAFDLLALLIEAAPCVVSKSAAHKRLWPNGVVSDATLVGLVKELRRALADEEPHSPVIRTVHRVGYAFEAPVVTSEAGHLTGRERSIAVLPFANLSPNPDDAYFAAGIHDELVAQLAKIRSFKVIARTSMLTYANSGKSIAEIADELQVETVMEGSVRYTDGRVRITAQLIDAVTSRSLWSEVYERRLADALAVQADVARNVVNALGAGLSLSEWQEIDSPATVSPEAYALFLRLRSDPVYFHHEARQHPVLDRVIELDPNFASAYAHKARLYVWSLIDTITSAAVDATGGTERERQVREYAERALLLDPSNGTAHAALGNMSVYRWQWSKAEEIFERAYVLGATDELLRGYAWFNSYAGRYAEAIRQSRRLLSLNPKDWGSHWNLAVSYGYAGKHAAAIAALRDACQIAPTVPILRIWLAHMAAARGHSTEALNELQTAEQFLGQPGDEHRLPIHLPELAHAYGRLGRRADAQRLFNEIENLAAAGRPVGAGTWAQAYLAIGDQDEALKWLRVAIDKIKKFETDPGFLCLMFLKANVLADPILELPEFAELRAQLTGQ